MKSGLGENTWTLLSGHDGLATPAIVLLEGQIRATTTRLKRLSGDLSCQLLYAMKANALPEVLEMIAGGVAGFSASSLFEARLGRQLLQEHGSVHLVSPGLTEDDVPHLRGLCDFVILNSMPQWERLRRLLSPFRCGLRINPQKSLVADRRYDPCGPFSKLGVPLDQLAERLVRDPAILDGIEGMHFHTNCEAKTFTPWLATIRHLEAQLGKHLARLRWINLGGGYEFPEGADPAPLREAVDTLRGRYSLDVFVEPGLAVLKDAGVLVTTVTDLFESGGKWVAMLDTTTNHLPEVFEYGYRPSVAGEDPAGSYSYVLAGRSCLAGDLLGEYRFGRPLSVRDRLVILDQAAYSLVKSHPFNGIPLPNVYVLDSKGSVRLIREFGYSNYLSWSGTSRG